MQDAPHIAAVDPHAEGDGGDNDVELLGGKRVLDTMASVRIEASMVRFRRDAIGLQRFRHVLRVFP